MSKSKVSKAASTLHAKKEESATPDEREIADSLSEKSSSPMSGNGHGNGHSPGPADKNASIDSTALKLRGGTELAEKIKEMVRLAQEQGYLTYNDINDALPESMITPDDLDAIYIQLRNLDIEIVDQAEV